MVESNAAMRDNLVVRMTPQDLWTAKTVAEKRGQTLSDFVRAVVSSEVKRTILNERKNSR